MPVDIYIKIRRWHSNFTKKGMPYAVSFGIIGFNEEMIFELNFDEFLRKDKEIKGKIFE